MANRSDRDDLHAPPIFKTFAGNAGQQLLDSTAAPATAQHLPCSVLFQVATAGHTFVFKDSLGASNTLKFPVTGTFHYRMAPLSFETGGTADASDAITVFWQPLARCG